MDRPEIVEATLLSTCNRVEVVVTTENPDGAKYALYEFFARDLANGPVVELPSAQASDNERVLQSMEAACPNAAMIDGTPMTEERLSEIYGLVLKRCADHPMYPSPTCWICSCFEFDKKGINAIHQGLAKQPCETHTETVSSTCPRCVLWAVHCNDLKGEKDIHLFVTDPSNHDF